MFILFTVVEPGTPGYKKILKTFGSEVFKEDGSLDREALGKIIFADSSKRQALNGITHPEIYKAILWRLAGLLVKGTSVTLMALFKAEHHK